MSLIATPDVNGLLLDELRLTAPSQVNRSAWTGKRKVIGMPGIELWAGRATIDMLATEADEREWRAFLFALRGPANYFKWVLPCNTHAGNKPVVGGSPGNGYTLPLSGLAVSQTILVAGQFITVPLPSGYDRTVCLTADLVSDGSGLATATFEPALGETPTVGVTVETKDPFIRMSPVSSSQGFTLSDGVSGVSFDVEEAR